MTFRYKVSKTLQVKQFEPLTIEAEFTSEEAKTDEEMAELAEKVETFVRKRLAKETKWYAQNAKALNGK